MIQAFRSQQLGLPRWPWRRAGEQRDTPTQLKGPPRLHLFSRHVLERPANGPPRPRSAATASTSHRHRRASSRGVSVGGVPARLAVSASACRRASRRGRHHGRHAAQWDSLHSGVFLRRPACLGRTLEELDVSPATYRHTTLTAPGRRSPATAAGLSSSALCWLRITASPRR